MDEKAAKLMRILEDYNSCLDRPFTEAQIEAHAVALSNHKPDLVALALTKIYSDHDTGHKPKVQQIKAYIAEILQEEREAEKQTKEREGREALRVLSGEREPDRKDDVSEFAFQMLRGLWTGRIELPEFWELQKQLEEMTR